MFVDKVKVSVAAGKGGDGIVSFRHEKFVDRGGPNGGDGGKGGNVVAVASRNQNTLAAFRYKKLLSAEAGQNGQKQKKHGRSGKDLYIKVPVGTVVTDEKAKVVADFIKDGQESVIARGGKGGYGNAHFTSSRRQTPKVAEKGEKGESYELLFELKTIADVGLIGMPNAGKSTLLSRISHARPEIADYPFTTLRPNLGVADIDSNNSLLVADIPGLIKGASQGKGLGVEFLRHVERTKVLIHLIDIYQNNVAKTYQTIQDELAAYPINLTKRPQVVALNKIEGLDSEIIDDQIKTLKTALPKNAKIFAISAMSGQGLRELLFAANQLAQQKQSKAAKVKSKLPVIKLKKDDSSWKVTKKGKTFAITGKKIERFAERTDFDNPAGVQRLRDIMTKMGITHELLRRGIEPKSKIKIGSSGEFKY